ncbi:MAG: 2'-5' RNA ligase family protein, partial [Actinomycetota bacterium]|nr:2'-5' RNA ligase family protein [Actinomycetota bacterium]
MSDAASSSGDVLTVGVSIPIPAPFGPHLHGRRTAYGDPLGAVTPAHVTLLGPTVVDSADLSELTDHLTAAATEVSPFVMTLRGTGTFRPV